MGVPFVLDTSLSLRVRIFLLLFRSIYFHFVSAACGQYGDEMLSLGGARQVARDLIICIVVLVSLSALVDFSSPDGEVTGQRSWTSRR